MVHADGSITYPRGHGARGLIMYDAGGMISVQLLHADYANQSGNLADFQVAMELYLAYYGTFSVDAQARTVSHHIEGCSFPGWIGTTQVRSYQFEEPRLTLSAVGDGTRILLWERAD